MPSLLSFDEQALRDLISSEIAFALAEAAEPVAEVRWLDVAAAATYLSTSGQAIRALVKRKHLKPYKSDTGRLLFTTTQLDLHAQGGNRV